MVTSAQQVIGRRKKLAEMFTVQRVVSCGRWQIRLPAAGSGVQRHRIAGKGCCKWRRAAEVYVNSGPERQRAIINLLVAWGASQKEPLPRCGGATFLEARNRWAAIWPPLPSHQPSSRELKTQRDAVAKQPDWEWPDENESVLMEHQSDSTVQIGSPSRKLYKDGGSHTGLRWYAAFTENLDPAARFWGCFYDGFKD